MESYDAKEVKADEAARKLLYKATAEGPWTEPAWRAAHILGLVKE
jgi:hypothetical protein